LPAGKVGGALPGLRVSKTVPEPVACVSATGEVRKGGHGVPDPVFAFRRPDRAPNPQPPAITLYY